MASLIGARAAHDMTLYTRAASARATCNPRIDARWYKNACSTTCRGTAVREAQQAHCLGCRVFAEHGHRMSDHLLDHHLPTLRACRPGLRLPGRDVGCRRRCFRLQGHPCARPVFGNSAAYSNLRQLCTVLAVSSDFPIYACGPGST